MRCENALDPGGRYPQSGHVPAVQSRGLDLSPRAGDRTSGDANRGELVRYRRWSATMEGCLRAGSRRGVQLARSGRHARTASAARARHSNAPRPAPGRDAVRQKPRQLYLACEAAILAVVTRSSTTRKAIETQRDLFLGPGMHDPRDAPRGSLRTGGL